MVAPAAPEPVHAPHPEPRPVWTSPDGSLRAFVLDWTDQQRKRTVQVHARHGKHWDLLGSDDLWPCIVALVLCWDDAHGARPEAADAAPE